MAFWHRLFLYPKPRQTDAFVRKSRKNTVFSHEIFVPVAVGSRRRERSPKFEPFVITNKLQRTG